MTFYKAVQIEGTAPEARQVLTASLPVESTQSKMPEECSPPLQSMITVLALAMLGFYVNIKQFVACSSKTPIKYSVAGLTDDLELVVLPV